MTATTTPIAAETPRPTVLTSGWFTDGGAWWGVVLWGIAVRALPVAVSTSLLYLVPGVAVLIAFLWLGERPTRGEAVGGLVILAGVALLTNADRLSRTAITAKQRRSTPPPTPRAGTRSGAAQAREVLH